QGVLLLSDDDRISIMVNEEDHVRIQVMEAGMEPESAYALAKRIDQALDERLRFAYDDRLGYLTQCPTNLGTGMRVSLMLHLPAMQENGAVQQLANTVSKLGLTIRGAYGEGTQPHGAFYQISNQVTLGISEEAAIENLRGIAEQVVKKERALQADFLKKPEFCDAVWRSLGVLKYARILTQEEALRRLSFIRIGVVCGMLNELSMDTVALLTDVVRVGCLMVEIGRDLSATERDEERATLVRQILQAVS
ncbi:MAG: ATP--guanido phosphotransferase, partial [Clostridia bacterium]|nr:ATP--guanido phosphotransferase [Clostridia bacterium]